MIEVVDGEELLLREEGMKTQHQKGQYGRTRPERCCSVPICMLVVAHNRLTDPKNVGRSLNENGDLTRPGEHRKGRDEREECQHAEMTLRAITAQRPVPGTLQSAPESANSDLNGAYNSCKCRNNRAWIQEGQFSKCWTGGAGKQPKQSRDGRSLEKNAGSAQ